MDPVRNPFSPGAGSPPPELAGRSALIEQIRIALARIRAGRSEKSLLLVGLRGVGKTVLLNRLQDIANDTGYKSFLVEAHEDKPLPVLLLKPLQKILSDLDHKQRVNQKVKRAMRILRGFLNGVKISFNDVSVGLDIEPETGVADSGDIETDLPELFVAVAEAAQDQKTSIALLIDEIQCLAIRELSALIMAIHKISQKQLPLILVGAGLPVLPALAGESKSYAERLFEFPRVGPLADDDARTALQGPAKTEGVKFDDAALKEIIHWSQGYPYFLQEWGYQVWNQAQHPAIGIADVKAATQKVIDRLDANFFRVRFDRLTPREKSYLRALAELGSGSHRSGDIAELMGTTVNAVAPLRASLIKKGMIYSPAHGDTAFTVPLFDAFMKRTMPL